MASEGVLCVSAAIQSIMVIFFNSFVRSFLNDFQYIPFEEKLTRILKAKNADVFDDDKILVQTFSCSPLLNISIIFCACDGKPKFSKCSLCFYVD